MLHFFNKKGDFSMKDIIKIVIKSSSNSCNKNEDYHDKVTITKESIAYEYKPLIESELNPFRKWCYKTNSPIFRLKYEELKGLISKIKEKGMDDCYTNTNNLEFTISYSDKSKDCITFLVSSNYFEPEFRIIKSMIPECEYTPAVLLTEEDFKNMKIKDCD